MNPNLSGTALKTGLSGPLAVVFLAFLITALTACSNSNFPEQDSFQTPILNKNTMFMLGPGDNIRIRVYEHEDLSGSYNVDDTGRIFVTVDTRCQYAGSDTTRARTENSKRAFEKLYRQPQGQYRPGQIASFLYCGGDQESRLLQRYTWYEYCPGHRPGWRLYLPCLQGEVCGHS